MIVLYVDPQNRFLDMRKLLIYITVDSQNSGQQNSGLLAFFGNNFENRHIRAEVSLTDGLISC